MRSTRRRILAAAAASASLGGCLGSDAESSPTDEPTETPTETPSETPTDTEASDEGMSGPTVQVRSHPDHGDVLAGPDGMTLYMFDSDTQGEGASTCHDDCANAWPPLTVEGEPTAGEEVTASLGTFEREDGTTQVTAGGWPLYYFANDESPGDANGQGVGGVWWVLRPDGTPVRAADTETPDESMSGPTVQVRSHPDHGDVLVGPEEMTLYMFDSDTQGEGASACHDDCADAWPPLTVEGEPAAGDGVTASLGTFEREDGTTQVTADGWPLYYFANDESPGDANGQGVGGVWWVLRPDGTPVRAADTETPMPTPTPTPTPTEESGGGGYPG